MNRLLSNISTMTLCIIMHTSSYGMETKVDPSVIPNASYLIYEGAADIVGGIPTSSRLVTFYTCDGTPLQQMNHQFKFPVMTRKLDQSAPKPRPTTYTLAYWPAIQIGFGMTKGKPGDFIIFYDQHGNRIESFRYDGSKPAGKDDLLKFSEKLDLSIVIKKSDQ
jgi:hypothetical protein